MLWTENAASVAYRYKEAPREVFYRWERHALNDPWTLIKQLDCYDYQSCEHPAWENSKARKLTDALRMRTLPELGAANATYQQSERWDAAPWGID